MQLILFCGIQGSGKSTFYTSKFFNSHLRISMDLLNTRNKERRFLATAFEVQQRVVIDNTNPTIAERSIYIEAAKAHKYRVIGYFFESKVADCLARNDLRDGKAKIPIQGVLATAKKLEIPDLKEGFDELYFVSINADNKFEISPWENEI